MQKGKYKLGIEREAERSTSLHKTNKQKKQKTFERLGQWMLSHIK